MPEKTSSIEVLHVIVERVRTTSDKFSVYEARLADQIAPPLTVKQFTGPARERQRWTVCGSYHEHSWTDRRGRRHDEQQFVAEFATLASPTTPAELDDFISSGLVEGWDGEQVYELRRHPDRVNLIQIIEERPQELIGYVSITAEMMASLREAWQRGTSLAATYAGLGELGLGGSMSDRLIKRYGWSTIGMLEANPYTPIFDVDRYGWKHAESVARTLGIDTRDKRRLAAGYTVAIAEATWKDGHTWMTPPAALAASLALLALPIDELQAGIDGAYETGLLIRRGDHIYPASLYEAEQGIAASVAQRLSRDHTIIVCRTENDALSAEQWEAVRMACAEPLSLLTGGPGCGKTTTIKQVIEEALLLGRSVTLMAPTGKAARRMTEATGHPATTIHSRLGLAPGQWGSNEELHGMVVVDEVSMLDTQLAAAVFRAVAPSANLLLVGDPDQLPSVGPGAVLRDLIACEAIPRVHLTRVFRNDAGVAVNAARIRAGEMVLSLPDCAVIKTESPEHTAGRIISYIAREAPKDVLVLVPTNNGPLGRYALCRELQAVCNPGEAGRGMVIKRESITEEIRRGDKIMMTRNDSTQGYYNGDQGVVIAVDIPRSITVLLDGEREVILKGENKRDCTLAYAITGHKSQGSEAPLVIVAVQPGRVLGREWLYTAMTRGKQQVYLVGDAQAMDQAIRTVRTPERRTGLVEAIEAALA